jgi:hemoglobin/transferrin/lactoferrin receptor protein
MGRVLPFLVGLLAFSSGARTQVQAVPQTDSLELQLDSSILLQSALVIGRRDEVRATLPYQVETISAADIRRTQSLTTADALANLSGVYVQKSQLGGGSPVLRGFEANRVLLVVDGVRMNNAIYRNGHLQNAITVDPNVLERTELIYGAGALAYGSDAIGGVVHFRTRQPEFREEGGTSGFVTGNISSAARAVNGAVGMEYGSTNWAGLSAVSTTRFGDLRAGGWRPEAYGDFGLRREYVRNEEIVDNPDPQRLVGSGYSQYNALQKFRFRLGSRVELELNGQYSTSSEVPRYDALIERRDGRLRWARWDYGPQTRLLTSARLSDRRPTRWYDVATYLLGYQFVKEDRFQRRLGDPVLQESRVDVGSYTLQADFGKSLGPRTKLRYGADLRYDRVAAGASPASEPTRYPSAGSDLAGAGAYLDLSREVGERWELRGGLRYNFQRLSATFGADDPVAWPAPYLAGIGNRTNALTAALGGHYRMGGHGLRWLYAQAFRAPNVDDFAKFREQGGRVQVPNPDLDPERSHTFEFAYTRQVGKLYLEATTYATLLTNAIIRRSGTLPDSSDFFVSRGDTLFVDVNVNADRAWVYGIDLVARWRLTNGLELWARASGLRGRRVQSTPDGNELTLPQDHIPPPYGSLGLVHSAGRWTATFRLDAQVEKDREAYAVNEIQGSAATGYVLDRLGTPDNLEWTPRQEGVPGWWTVNLYGEYHLNERLSVQLKGENLADRFYWRFASGIAAAGVDVGIGVRWGW